MNDDPFRDWLVRRIAHVDDLAAGNGGTIEQRIQLRELVAVLRCCDAEKVAGATNHAGTANHADTADTPRTDDPDAQAAHEAAMDDYRRKIKDILVDELIVHDGIVTQHAVEAIAALPKPVKGGEDHA